MIFFGRTLKLKSSGNRAGQALPAWPQAVKLVICAGDIVEPINLCMSNLILEGYANALKIVSNGGFVGIECIQEKAYSGRFEIVTSEVELIPWKEFINRVVLVKGRICV